MWKPGKGLALQCLWRRKAISGPVSILLFNFTSDSWENLKKPPPAQSPPHHPLLDSHAFYCRMLFRILARPKETRKHSNGGMKRPIVRGLEALEQNAAFLVTTRKSIQIMYSGSIHPHKYHYLSRGYENRKPLPPHRNNPSLSTPYNHLFHFLRQHYKSRRPFYRL